MRAVVQLVSQSSVVVENNIVGRIDTGLLVLLGVGNSDNESDSTYLAKKISGLRIFPDKDKLMNKSLLDINGEMLVVSQFTLYGDCRKGRRPSFSQAASPDQANKLYLVFMEQVKKLGITVASGTFQAMMQVNLTNQGPITIMLDSKKSF